MVIARPRLVPLRASPPRVGGVKTQGGSEEVAGWMWAMLYSNSGLSRRPGCALQCSARRASEKPRPGRLRAAMH
jgi:hypothetical protein